MAGSVNLVILIGNLGKDPEIITGRNGKVAKFSVATSESWRDKTTGERQEVTDWHNITVFETHSVEFAEKYLKKGNKVYIEGKQKTRKWEKDGVTHYSTDVVLSGFGSKLQSLTSSGTGRGAPSEDDYGTARTSDAGERSSSSERAADRRAINNNDMDDDIPF